MRSAAKRKETENGRGGLDMANEALGLLRTLPLHVVATYFVGTVPFIVGFLFFWSDMSRSAFAYQRCFSASLGLAGLFVWMKCWQVLFSRGVRAEVSGQSPPRLTPARLVRLAGSQLMLQPYGLVLIPVSMLLTVTFSAAYGYYQNVTALGDGTHTNTRELSRRAWRQALLWPRQNCVLLWLLCPWVLALGMLTSFGAVRALLSLSTGMPELATPLWFILSLALMFYIVFPLCPFGCAVAGNVAVLVVSLPHLLKSLFGIDTMFTLSGWHGIFNTTFLIVVYGLSFLCLDPIVKTAFALRCFYGESQQSGEDLRAELKEIQAPGEPPL